MSATSVSDGNLRKTLNQILKRLESIEQEVARLNRRRQLEECKDQPIRNKGYVNNNKGYK